MTTDGGATKDSQKKDSSFNCCSDMMKMMSRCMDGKGEKINFEEFCGKMSNRCREMMKNAQEKNKD